MLPSWKLIVVILFPAKVFVHQLYFVVDFVITRLKVVLSDPIVAMNIDYSFVLWRKHLRNLIVTNNDSKNQT
jgi:hypothetical protein